MTGYEILFEKSREHPYRYFEKMVLRGKLSFSVTTISINTSSHWLLSMQTSHKSIYLSINQFIISILFLINLFLISMWWWINQSRRIYGNEMINQLYNTLNDVDIIIISEVRLCIKHLSMNPLSVLLLFIYACIIIGLHENSINVI